MPVWLNTAIWIIMLIWTYDEFNTQLKIHKANKMRGPGSSRRNTFGIISKHLYIVAIVFWLCYQLIR